MSKYDWSNIPKEANWMATDSIGLVCCYTVKPFIWGNEWMVNKIDEVVTCFRSIEIDNWKDSLEERPK